MSSHGEELAREAELLREDFQLVFSVHPKLSGSRRAPPGGEPGPWCGRTPPVEPQEEGDAEGQRAQERQRDKPRPLDRTERLSGEEIGEQEGGHQEIDKEREGHAVGKRRLAPILGLESSEAGVASERTQ